MLVCFLASLALSAPPQDRSTELESALALAGANRPAIEAVLAHYAEENDAEKLAAARFLITEMPGHGRVDYGLFDAAGNEIAFDALAYPNLDAAQAALDALEVEHGPLDFAKKALVEDLQVLTTDALVANVDGAFRVWRERPWARDVTFETFCEYLLPHRGSNEPAEDWRGPLEEALRGPLAGLEDDVALNQVVGLANAAARERVGFATLFYLHPTDQGFAEMCSNGRGRCEDITNMVSYAMRVAGVVAAADYTPFWGHRDNNHAWPVTLDGAGRGSAPDGRLAAKVYRKTYSKQRGNLCFQLAEGESAPPWLDRPTYVDVTDQYGPTSDVEVALDAGVSERFAYLCVFNGGDWKPICWARVSDGRATFPSLGRGLLYLPATWVDGAVQPAGEPFVLEAQGTVRTLRSDPARPIEAALFSATARAAKAGPDGGRLPQFEAGQRYELFVWRAGWHALGIHVGGDGPFVVHDLPANALFWLVQEGSRRLERPFRMEGGRQVFL